jgi:1-acyl-sn-glycerol-3-phosphate acyltransferase
MAYTYSRAWRGFTIAIVPAALTLLLRRDWRAREQVPRSGGLIVAANHISEADPLAVAHYLWKCGRYPVFLAKSALFRKGLVGRVVRGTGQIPVDRGGAAAAGALEAAEDALAAGQCLIFYPEGTCTRDPELWPMTGQTGVARLALSARVPVIPMASWGAHELLPYPKGDKAGLAATLAPGLHLYPPKKIHVITGPPVDLSQYANQPQTVATLQAATTDIMQAIAGLLGELRGQQPPAELYDRHQAAQRQEQDQ